ncbi:NUDIX domain-containing protein [Haladaptatus sp. NG-SE-30]
MEASGYVVNIDGVVVRDDEYLLIERGADEEHAAGLLGFPGGKVEGEPGDEAVIENTVARELREEVGVEVGNVEYVLSTTFEADDGTRCLNILTLCEYESGEAYPRAPDEVAAVHWLSYDEINDREDVPAFTEHYIDRIEEYRTDR